jgi:tetratricopeptide (TPR) repeat protein
MRLSRLCAALLVLVPAVANADDIAGKLASYESEAHGLATDLPNPNQLTGAQGQKKLVDAEVSYSLGDYDQAALVLFDLVGKGQSSDPETATYYLAESLYQKGDLGSAHQYFDQIVKSSNTSSKYYQPSLERLVEISIKDNSADAGEYVNALSGLNAGLRQPSVPYVLGKYAYSQGKYDDAIGLFAQVPKGSDYELQALYYTGTTLVAKKDVAKATDTFTDLINRKPRTSVDRRVIELGQLALGRLYYEREEPSKSIDAYLLVDRRSDLFPDALYEVAWVYVKSKQFDKALRALELLEQSDPNTTKTPTVRILEGNLRIRKAQMIRQAQVNGTVSPNDATDPSVEYDKAAKLFTDTHDQYMPSYQALSMMVDGNLDPASFIQQIAGRQEHVFQLAAPIPEAAAQWLRDEPAVQRFVSVETDLADVSANITQTEANIAQLNAVIAAKDHSGLYPAIAARRSRIEAIQQDLVRIRSAIHDKAGVSSPERKALESQYFALGNPEQAFTDRVTTAHEGFDKIDADATEIDGTIGGAQAMAVALRKYANDSLSSDQKTKVQTELDSAAQEAQAIEDELGAVHREVELGKDLASIGDDGILQARSMRKQVTAAQDNEARSMGSNDLAQRAMRLADNLDQTDAQMAQLTEQALAEAKNVIAEEEKHLAEYKSELAGYEAEAKAAGATVLGASFKNVKAKFYDVIVRTDVGNVDVAWSQKEDTDDDLKRLNLARSRELKQLKDEFKDILDQSTEKPSAPKKKSELPPATEGPSGSPDKGAGDQRVSPGSGNTQTPASPTVKPDEQKSAKAPKGGGSVKKGGSK